MTTFTNFMDQYWPLVFCVGLMMMGLTAIGCFMMPSFDDDDDDDY